MGITNNIPYFGKMSSLDNAFIYIYAKYSIFHFEI